MNRDYSKSRCRIELEMRCRKLRQNNSLRWVGITRSKVICMFVFKHLSTSKPLYDAIDREFPSATFELEGTPDLAPNCGLWTQLVASTHEQLNRFSGYLRMATAMLRIKSEPGDFEPFLEKIYEDLFLYVFVAKTSTRLQKLWWITVNFVQIQTCLISFQDVQPKSSFKSRKWRKT